VEGWGVDSIRDENRPLPEGETTTKKTIVEEKLKQIAPPHKKRKGKESRVLREKENRNTRTRGMNDLKGRGMKKGTKEPNEPESQMVSLRKVTRGGLNKTG